MNWCYQLHDIILLLLGLHFGHYNLDKMISIVVEYIIASRPYSFTASIIPVLMTAVVVGSSLRSEMFIRAMIMGVAAQAGANLTNTYFDFHKGVDTKCMEGGDKALVDAKKITVLVFLYYQ